MTSPASPYRKLPDQESRSATPIRGNLRELSVPVRWPGPPPSVFMRQRPWRRSSRHPGNERRAMDGYRCAARDGTARNSWYWLCNLLHHVRLAEGRTDVRA